jgi:hypothetical protein
MRRAPFEASPLIKSKSRTNRRNRQRHIVWQGLVRASWKFGEKDQEVTICHTLSGEHGRQAVTLTRSDVRPAAGKTTARAVGEDAP